MSVSRRCVTPLPWLLSFYSVGKKTPLSVCLNSLWRSYFIRITESLQAMVETHEAMSLYFYLKRCLTPSDPALQRWPPWHASKTGMPLNLAPFSLCFQAHLIFQLFSFLLRRWGAVGLLVSTRVDIRKYATSKPLELLPTAEYFTRQQLNN